MDKNLIPKFSTKEYSLYFSKAENSVRRRHNLILHNPGDHFNRVVNFLFEDSYMQPHLHPESEKTEKMYLMKGSFALITFNDEGDINEITVLKLGELEYIEVPPFTWHTYIMLTQKTAIYETMKGAYDPLTWKEMAGWAPSEDSIKAKDYFLNLSKSIEENTVE